MQKNSDPIILEDKTMCNEYSAKYKKSPLCLK